MTELTTDTINVLPKRKGKPLAQLNITSKRRIGSGISGTAFQAEVTVGNHARNVVIKQFKTIDRRGIVTTAKENVANAIANYERAKKAGLKVFTTYRLSEDGESVVMTSGNTESVICIGTEPETSLPSMGEPKIASIESAACANLINGVFAQANLAEKHGISINPDAFFFLYDRNTGGIDFVIGDLDNVRLKSLDSSWSRLFSNLSSAKISLESFVVDNVENPGTYLKLIDEAYGAQSSEPPKTL